MDDTYAAVAEAVAAKKKARKVAYTAPALPPPLPEEEADGARGINQVHLSSRVSRANGWSTVGSMADSLWHRQSA